MESFELNLTNNRQVAEKLKSCPFCGKHIMISKIGNDYSKSKKVEIYCDVCKYAIVKASLRTHDDALRHALFFWENRNKVKNENAHDSN